MKQTKLKENKNFINKIINKFSKIIIIFKNKTYGWYLGLIFGYRYNVFNREKNFKLIFFSLCL